MATVVAGACGTEQVTSSTAPLPGPSTTSAPTTNPPTTAAPATTPTLPPTTPPAPPAPTTLPPTTAPVAPTGWRATSIRPGASVQGHSGNWAGIASPAAPTVAGELPTDGFYSATLLGPWTPGATVLRVRIERLAPCTELPVDTCSPSTDPAELGIDPTWAVDVDVPLDAGTRVVVAGFDCWEATPTTDPNTGAQLDDQNRLGSGADLAALFEAYTADYSAAILPLFGSGADPYSNPDEFAGTPTDGLVTESEACPNGVGGSAGPLRYASGNAPVLLLQSVVDWDGQPLDATDLVQLTGVWFDEGMPTYTFFASFTS